MIASGFGIGLLPLLFYSLSKLFTCMQRFLAHSWLINSTQSKSNNKKKPKIFSLLADYNSSNDQK